jgi:hypothetical protein
MAQHLTTGDCIYNAVEGTDVDMLWDGGEDEGTECEYGDNDNDW